MGLGVDQAVAELLRDGDPVRSILGLAATEGFTMYDVGDGVREIWVGEEPPQPDETVTVAIDGGDPPMPGAYGQGVGQRPGFTVRTRGESYDTTQSRAHTIYRLLDEFEGLVHAVPFWRIRADSEPIPLGRDREERGGRWVWTQSFSSATKRYSPS